MDPLPAEAFVLHGGCNCQAIRYKISVPPLSERPVNFYSKSRSAGAFPMTAHCHCNDCRRGTGAILPSYICTPASMMSVSLLQGSMESSKDANPLVDAATSNFTSDAGPNRNESRAKPDDEDDRRGSWLPAEEALRPGSNTSRDNTFVRFYESGKTTIRTFCGRCGVMISYTKMPMPQGYPLIYDVNLATLDKDDLDKDWMRPRREVFWNLGIRWVRDLTRRKGERSLCHPLNDIDVTV